MSASTSTADTVNPSTSPATTATAPASAQPAFKYFRAPASAQQPRPDLPDKYFEPSVSDIRAQQASLTARRDALQNAPLKTAAMREAENKKRTARWPTTTIRIKFTDNTSLEKTFPSTDKIRSVYAFMRNSLREDAKSDKFVLYQPPKVEYKVSDLKVRDQTLADLGFSPSSVLLIRFVDDAFNHPNVPPPLDPAVLAAIEDYPTPPSFDESPTPPKDSGSGSKPRGNFFGKKEEDGERKLPKWLKLGPK